MLTESWYPHAFSERRTCYWGQLSKQDAIWFLAVGPELPANCFAFGQTFERLPHYLSNNGVKKSELDKNSKAWIRMWLANEEQRFTVALVCLLLPGGSCTVWICVYWAGVEETHKAPNWPKEALPGLLNDWLMSWLREVVVYQWKKLSGGGCTQICSLQPSKAGRHTLGGEVHWGSALLPHKMESSLS